MLFLYLCMWVALPLHSHTYIPQKNYIYPLYTSKDHHLHYANPNAPQGGMITLESSSRSFTTFNPYTLRGGVSAPGIELLHGTLMDSPLDDPTVLYPSLALSVQRHDTTITIHLRSHLTFHDGSPLTSESVRDTFLWLKKASIFAKYLTQLVHIECPSEHTVRLSFKEMDHKTFFALAKAPVLHAHMRQEGKPIGCGPYRVAEHVPQHYLLYQKIPKFWGQDLFLYRGLYNATHVKYMFYNNYAASFEGFKKHEYDIRYEWRASAWKNQYTFPALDEGKVVKKAFKKPIVHGLNTLAFNTQHPALKRLNIRKALTLLFDFPWINQAIFHNMYARNTSIFMNSGFAAPPVPTEAEKALMKKLDITIQTTISPQTKRQRTIEATQLLSKEGCTYTKETRLFNGQPMVFKLLSNNPGDKRFLKHYVHTLKSLGIRLLLDIVDPAAFHVRMRARDYDLIMYRHPPVNLPSDEQQDIWGGEGPENLSGARSPTLSILTQGIARATSHKELLTYTSVLDRYIHQQHLMIPLWAPDNNYLAHWQNVTSKQTPYALFFPHSWWLHTC